MNNLVIVLLGENKDKAELLRTLILPNENLSKHNTSLEGESCGMQVSVIDATDISERADSMDNKLAADWKSALSPDAQYLFALVLVAENGKFLPEDKSTFDRYKLMFEEHDQFKVMFEEHDHFKNMFKAYAEKNMVLSVFSQGDVEQLCEEDDTLLGQMLNQGRYIVFNENSKGIDLVEKLRQFGEYKTHSADPTHSNGEQTREEQKPTKRYNMPWKINNQVNKVNKIIK